MWEQHEGFEEGDRVIAPSYGRADTPGAYLIDYRPATVLKIYPAKADYYEDSVEWRSLTTDLPPGWEEGRVYPLLVVQYESLQGLYIDDYVPCPDDYVEKVLQCKTLPFTTPAEDLAILNSHIKMEGDCLCGGASDVLGLFPGLEEVQKCLVLDRLASIGTRKDDR